VSKASDFESALEKALASKGPALINVITEIEAMAPRSTTERAPAKGQ
jgi:thiamine pyrophosphate-dependent acetolactate synthase large subunit-like protein